jgi:tetratricopeptide (TPR) repeat protein
MARQVHDEALLGRALREQGATAALRNERGDVRLAIKLHNEALQIQRKRGTPEDVADTLVDLGRDYWVLSKGDRALQYYDEARRIDPHLSPSTLNHIGSAYFVKADYDTAITYFQEGLKSAKDVGSLRWEAENSNDIGAAYVGKGEYQQAATHLRRAVELYKKVGDRRVESIAYGNLAGAYRNLRQLKEAQTCVDEALAIARDVGAKREEVWALHHAALIAQDAAAAAHDRQTYDEARKLFEQGLTLIGEGHGNDPRTSAGVLGDYAWLLFLAFGKRRRSSTLTRQAIRLLKANHLPRGHGFVTVAELQRRLNQMRRNATV